MKCCKPVVYSFRHRHKSRFLDHRLDRRSRLKPGGLISVRGPCPFCRQNRQVCDVAPQCVVSWWRFLIGGCIYRAAADLQQMFPRLADIGLEVNAAKSSWFASTNRRYQQFSQLENMLWFSVGFFEVGWTQATLIVKPGGFGKTFRSHLTSRPRIKLWRWAGEPASYVGHPDVEGRKHQRT